MVDLMLAGDEERIADPGVVRSVYDPCCGSGGMLMIAKEHIAGGTHINGDPPRPAINPQAEIHLFGQEVNPETWAVSKSDIFIKDPSGRDAANDRLRQHALHRPPCQPILRLPDRQSPLRQGLEARQGRGRSRTRTRSGWPLRPWIAAHQRRPDSVPASHARPCESGGARGCPHCDYHERLAAVYRRCGQRRERDSPLHL